MVAISPCRRVRALDNQPCGAGEPQGGSGRESRGRQEDPGLTIYRRAGTPNQIAVTTTATPDRLGGGCSFRGRLSPVCRVRRAGFCNLAPVPRRVLGAQARPEWWVLRPESPVVVCSRRFRGRIFWFIRRNVRNDGAGGSAGGRLLGEGFAGSGSACGGGSGFGGETLRDSVSLAVDQAVRLDGSH